MSYIGNDTNAKRMKSDDENKITSIQSQIEAAVANALASLQSTSNTGVGRMLNVANSSRTGTGRIDLASQIEV